MATRERLAFRDMPGYGQEWTDHSRRPLLGMAVRAYFKGAYVMKFLTEWCDDGCTAYFHDGHSLRWHPSLGFT